MENIQSEFGGPKPENKKIAAGILAILIGVFGIHKFYLGYNKEGIIQLILAFMRYRWCNCFSRRNYLSNEV